MLKHSLQYVNSVMDGNEPMTIKQQRLLAEFENGDVTYRRELFGALLGWIAIRAAAIEHPGKSIMKAEPAA